MRTSGKRVLIVEDDLDALELLRSWAEDLGCEVRTAPSGPLALEMSSAFQPDVLITDYRLEDEVTGVEVIVKLRKVGRPLTCVLITGVLHEALREALQRIQGVIILAKPVSLERLRQIISAA